jgi:hypothetical protein
MLPTCSSLGISSTTVHISLLVANLVFCTCIPLNTRFGGVSGNLRLLDSLGNEFILSSWRRTSLLLFKLIQVLIKNEYLRGICFPSIKR